MTKHILIFLLRLYIMRNAVSAKKCSRSRNRRDAIGPIFQRSLASASDYTVCNVFDAGPSHAAVAPIHIGRSMFQKYLFDHFVLSVIGRHGVVLDNPVDGRRFL